MLYTPGLCLYWGRRKPCVTPPRAPCPTRASLSVGRWWALSAVRQRRSFGWRQWSDYRASTGSTWSVWICRGWTSLLGGTHWNRGDVCMPARGFGTDHRTALTSSSAVLLHQICWRPQLIVYPWSGRATPSPTWVSYWSRRSVVLCGRYTWNGFFAAEGAGRICQNCISV